MGLSLILGCVLFGVKPLSVQDVVNHWYSPVSFVHCLSLTMVTLCVVSTVTNPPFYRSVTTSRLSPTLTSLTSGHLYTTPPSTTLPFCHSPSLTILCHSTTSYDISTLWSVSEEILSSRKDRPVPRLVYSLTGITMTEYTLGDEVGNTTSIFSLLLWSLEILSWKLYWKSQILFSLSRFLHSFFLVFIGFLCWSLSTKFGDRGLLMGRVLSQHTNRRSYLSILGS